MASYLRRRLTATLVMLIGTSLIVFTLVRLVPGDTATALLGAQYTEEQAEVIRARYGLDRPLPLQYLTWLGSLLRGDLGTSVLSGRPVLSVIVERLPVTLELAGFALLFAALVGIPLGILTSVRPGRFSSFLVSAFGLLGVSVPGFWLGTIFILLFALKLRWLPSGDFVPLNEDPVANFRHMLLPGIALGAAVSAVLMRMTRASMMEVLSRDYIRTARAQGHARRRVVFRFALKNALIPILTVVGIQAGYLIGGSIVIEQVFSLPGVGSLALQAINNRDYALMQGAVMFLATAFILINLAVDLLYGWANPQLASGGGARKTQAGGAG